MCKIVYVHVPKCGGSSFAAALRLRYWTSQAQVGFHAERVTRALQGDARIEADYALRQKDLHDHIASGTRCITGHVQANLETLQRSDYKWVTLLRAPEERFVSHYRYLQRHHPDAGRAQTLERFLSTPDAARLASQYLFYFGGVSQARAGDLTAAIARAKATLAHFHIVGDLAQPEPFMASLRSLCGWGVLRLHRNSAPSPTRIPAELSTEIAALCAVDRAIFEAALPERLAA